MTDRGIGAATLRGARKGLGRAGAVVAVLVAMGVFTSAASAAVVQKKPSSMYGANGTVRVTIVVGNVTYLGGQFTAMVPNAGGTAVTRNHVAAVDTTTGALLPWNPNVNGTVYTLAANPNNGNIYIGGTFTTAGATNAAHKNLVEVGTGSNNGTGAPVAAFANTLRPNKAVRGLALSPSGNLYVGGAFTTPRRFALEANGTTGALIPAFSPVISNTLGTSAEVRAIAVNPSGTRVILGGFFNQLNSGAPGDPNTTNLGVGAVDATTGASLRWDWHTTDLQTFRPFQLLAFAQDGSTLFGAGTGNGGSAMSWDIETGALNYIEGFNGNVVGVGVADGMLYIGGHFTGYDGPIPGSNFLTPVANRDKLAAVDEATGQVLSPWNPAVNTTLGIEALGAGGTSVSIGGEFTKAGGVTQQHFTLFHE
jgi:trimeric autotransporter adhesin